MRYSQKIGTVSFSRPPTVLINNINLNSVHRSVRGQRKGGATFFIFKMDELACGHETLCWIEKFPQHWHDSSISLLSLIWQGCLLYPVLLFVIFLSLRKVFTAAEQSWAHYIITLQCSFPRHCVHGNPDHFLPNNDIITDRGAWIIKSSVWFHPLSLWSCSDCKNNSPHPSEMWLELTQAKRNIHTKHIAEKRMSSSFFWYTSRKWIKWH